MKLNIPVLTGFGVLGLLNLVTLLEVKELREEVQVLESIATRTKSSLGEYTDGLGKMYWGPTSVSEAIKEIDRKITIVCDDSRCDQYPRPNEQQ